MIYGGMTNGTVVLDNSGAFQEYLRQNGMEEGLKKHKLKLRTVNKIVPHVSWPATSHLTPIPIPLPSASVHLWVRRPTLYLS
jgi:hypothetical protein